MHPSPRSGLHRGSNALGLGEPPPYSSLFCVWDRDVTSSLQGACCKYNPRISLDRLKRDKTLTARHVGTPEVRGERPPTRRDVLCPMLKYLEPRSAIWNLPCRQQSLTRSRSDKGLWNWGVPAGGVRGQYRYRTFLGGPCTELRSFSPPLEAEQASPPSAWDPLA